MEKKSGAHWVAQFPGSAAVDDLEEDFRGRVNKFIGALTAAGATARVTSTYRPPQRAYLMHWSYLIAKSGHNAQQVPAMTGVDIEWWHGTQDASKQAAYEMVAGYGTGGASIAPALTSRHTERKAIDIVIGWTGTLSIAKADGTIQAIATTPRDGTNPDLIELGKSYGVIHLINAAKDPPHWSTDGR